MNRLTDEQLIEELQERFRENSAALQDLKVVTRKLEEMNEKLQESEALKGNFLSNIRNEMNNPLTSIMGLSRQLISGEPLTPESVFPIASMIHSEAFSLDFQLRNIFAAAELEAGEMALIASAVDIDALVNSVIDMFRFRIFEKNIAVHYVPLSVSPKDRVLFKTDSEKLQLVIANLLSNAIEFSDDGGRVDIKVWTKGGYIGLSVEDNGIGIAEAHINSIFDRFKQLDSGSRKRHPGHGLGLSITKDLVGLMLGNITVSSAPGRGSIFKVDVIPELDINNGSGAFALNGNVFLFEEASSGMESGHSHE